MPMNDVASGRQQLAQTRLSEKASPVGTGRCSLTFYAVGEHGAHRAPLHARTNQLIALPVNA